MPLNAYLALALLAALLLSPLLLLASPFLWFALRRELAQRDAEGWKLLSPRLVRTLRSFAPVVLRGEESADAWLGVARKIDDYLVLARGPRRWRTLLLLGLLEFAPLLRGYAPLSRLSLERRMRFADRHLAAPRGLMRVFALARQIVRIGHYGRPIATLRVAPRQQPRELVELSA
ncbi:MAG: hypothetical protein IPN34_19520 [Planctomycetes bacterium]|nr:hypothetical protein [Planctomycetota bacterium]